MTRGSLGDTHAGTPTTGPMTTTTSRWSPEAIVRVSTLAPEPGVIGIEESAMGYADAVAFKSMVPEVIWYVPCAAYVSSVTSMYP